MMKALEMIASLYSGGIYLKKKRITLNYGLNELND